MTMRALPRRKSITGVVESIGNYRRGDITLDVLTIDGTPYFGGVTDARTRDRVNIQLTRLPFLYNLFCNTFRYARRDLARDDKQAKQYHSITILEKG